MRTPRWRHRLRMLVKVGFGVAQALLIGRIVLVLFAPWAANDLATGYIALTQPLVDPFRDAVRASLVEGASGTVLDTHALAALLGYSLLEIVLLLTIGWQRQANEPLPPLVVPPSATAG